MTTSWKKYILWFAQEHLDFRQAEINSLLRIWNIQMKTPKNHSPELPFWIVELPSDDAAKKLASRSMSLRCILELWTHSTSFSKFHDQLSTYIKENMLTFGNVFDKTSSFRLTVETYNKHFTQKEKVAKIDEFHYLPVSGPVNLNNPDVQWWYIEYYGMDPNNVPEQPDDVLFGKWISDGRRNMINEISLKTRKFIGNTSMDSQLSLLMANQGLVQKGHIVFDPFVGSGSLLVSAAKFGAYVMGSDIDYMILHGKSRPTRVNQKAREVDENIYANLKQYNCEQLYLDVLISDFSRSIWTKSLEFDSIVTDPPYGIREATERIEFKTKRKTTVLNEDVVHYPSTSHYHLFQLYKDLLIFSARHLKLGGRLVCWFPVSKKDYTEEMLPKHKCLKVVANSEQSLSAYTSRRLLTYEKISGASNEMEDFELKLMDDFREKYFNFSDNGPRKERKAMRKELRVKGTEEAIKRGKKLDENGKWKLCTEEENGEEEEEIK